MVGRYCSWLNVSTLHVQSPLPMSCLGPTYHFYLFIRIYAIFVSNCSCQPHLEKSHFLPNSSPVNLVTELAVEKSHKMCGPIAEAMHRLFLTRVRSGCSKWEGMQMVHRQRASEERKAEVGIITVQNALTSPFQYGNDGELVALQILLDSTSHQPQ